MHPYRDLPSPPPERAERCNEELVLYGLLAAVGAIPVVIALVRHTPFGLEPTIGLLMVCAGMLGLVVRALRARRA